MSLRIKDTPEEMFFHLKCTPEVFQLLMAQEQPQVLKRETEFILHKAVPSNISLFLKRSQCLKKIFCRKLSKPSSVGQV